MGGDTPSIEIETRQGQFEYLFIFCAYTTRGAQRVPEVEPIITSLRLWVEGNENNFVRDLDENELERLSRQNCHTYSNWRELHDKGQGLLLHLADLGLTNEAPFPKRKRVHITLKLLTTKEPEEDPYLVYTAVTREFHVCILRSNQLFESSHMDCRFTFLNEKL